MKVTTAITVHVCIREHGTFQGCDLTLQGAPGAELADQTVKLHGEASSEELREAEKLAYEAFCRVRDHP